MIEYSSYILLCYHSIVTLTLSTGQIHGRSRTQRYAKLANWEYVLQAARSQATKRIICQSPLPEQKPLCILLLQDPALPRIPVIGNGDILSYEDWQAHRGTILRSIIYLIVVYTLKYSEFISCI